ncbi:MAG TPA: class I SAM-dependent methyltransferase [Alphaproteobacteria bacterium]
MTRTRQAQHTDARVRAQYEDYPYPARKPEDEARRLVTGSPSHLAEIIHYLYAGRAPYGPGKRFRALIAGGGTGDGAIMLAQQLADAGADAEVVHLDVARAAARIAKARARARGLSNIRFVDGSLLDLEALGLGGFDYIDCCGVLHHLADPAAGLRALVRALGPGGGIGLMVYGTLGRTGVYHVQDALRLLADAGAPAKDRVALARSLLADLPETNWLRRNPFVADHLHGDDAGLHDLLLHARDRAYTVPEVFALCAGAGLAITSFIEAARYEPATYLHDADLVARAGALAWPERAALAELLSGAIKRHVVYAVTGSAVGRVAAPDSPDMVPVLREGDGQAYARALAATGRLTAQLENLTLSFSFGPLAPAILSRIDGVKSLAEIHAALTTDTDWAAFKAAFDDLHAKLNGINLLLLRAR